MANTWTLDDIPNLVGKIVIVTGGSRGIGFATSIELAKAGAELIILGRNEKNGKEAIEKIKELEPKANVTFNKVDLSSLASVKDFTKSFNARGKQLDILVNNAAIFPTGEKFVTNEGFETTFVTNYLSHFALTCLLLPSLRKSPSPRIVNVSSAASDYGKMEFDHLQSAEKPLQSYGNTKLAQLLFTFQLQRQSDLKGWGLTVVAVHPGLVKTDMTIPNPESSLFQKFVGYILNPFFGQTPLEGARSSLYAATSPNAEKAGYYGPSSYSKMKGPLGKLDPPPTAKDEKIANQLWNESERLAKVSWP